MKKQKRTKHLDYYYKCMEEGGILYRKEWYFDNFYYGLCSAVSCEKLDTKTFKRFSPTDKDIEWLKWEGHNITYWGSDATDERIGKLTPLRQNILLFMAAIKGEL